MTSASNTPTSSGPGARRLLLAVVLVAVLLSLLVSRWALVEGYIPGLNTGCSSEGYPDPKPSYEELIARGKDPYCARAVNNETWW